MWCFHRFGWANNVRSAPFFIIMFFGQLLLSSLPFTFREKYALSCLLCVGLLLASTLSRSHAHLAPIISLGIRVVSMGLGCVVDWIKAWCMFGSPSGLPVFGLACPRIMQQHPFFLSFFLSLSPRVERVVVVDCFCC